jgi:hypothetical protein
MEEEIIETSKLQLASLKLFMRGLEYDYLGVDKVFHSSLYVNKSREYISFNRAVQLYNGLYNDIHGNPWFEEPFHTIPYEFFICAENAKIIHKVKMQKSYKKGIVVQSHKVEFVDKTQAELLLGGKKK